MINTYLFIYYKLIISHLKVSQPVKISLMRMNFFLYTILTDILLNSVNLC